jgi:hypothetical protein
MVRASSAPAAVQDERKRPAAHGLEQHKEPEKETEDNEAEEEEEELDAAPQDAGDADMQKQAESGPGRVRVIQLWRPVRVSAALNRYALICE